MRSQSKGNVHLNSKDYRDKPKVLFNCMSKDQDWQEFRAAVCLTRELFAQDAFKPYVGVEISPGTQRQSDDQLNAYLKDAVESAYHSSCTCKMGSDDMSVVNGECQVRGITGLRIVDSSIMPSIVSGNLNAPTVMMAEKAADIIKGIDALPASTVDFYVADDYQQSQR